MRSEDKKQNTREKFSLGWQSRDPVSRKNRRSRFRRKLGIESLEQRRVLAAITWINTAGGDWNSSGNWDLNRVPAASDDVVIPDLGSPGKDLTITFSSGSATVNSIINTETLRVAGGTLIDAGTLAGTGTLIVDGGTATFSGTSWTNNSTISLASGTLELGGNFTQAGLGIVNRNGGTVNLTGALTGGLALGTATGSWNMLSGASISNGTLTTADGTSLTVKAFSGATFRNMVVNGNVDYSGPYTTLKVVGDLELNGTISIGSQANQMLLESQVNTDNQQITGTGRINMNGSTGGINEAFLNQSGIAHTVTIGSGITLSATASRNYIGGLGTWINHGLIKADGPGRGISIRAGGTFVNESDGVISALSTGSVEIDGLWTNKGIIRALDFTTLSFGGTWTNEATIDAKDSVLNLGGSFTQAGLGIVNRNGGTVNLTGALTGGLALGTATGSWNMLSGASISNGTLTTADGTSLTVKAFSGATFRNMVVNGNVDYSGPYTTLKVVGDLELNGTISIGSQANQMLLESQVNTDNQQITGTGRINMNGSTGGINEAFLNQSGIAHTVTIGSGITISATDSRNYIGGLGTWINHGLIKAEGPGRGISLRPGSPFTNALDGVISAIDGGSVEVTETMNLVSGTLRGGTWQVVGNSLLRLPSGITTLAANVVLDGANADILVQTGTASALSDIAAIGVAGSLSIRNGKTLAMVGGVQNSGALAIVDGSTLTLAGVLQNAASGILTGDGLINGNLVNDGVVRPGSPLGTLTVNGNYTQSTTGNLELGIGGSDPLMRYDRLAVSGAVSLDGTFNVTLVNGFGPNLNQVFSPLMFASRNGDFAIVNIPTYGGNPFFSRTTTSTSVVLTSLIQSPDLAFDNISIPSARRYGQDLALTYSARNTSSVTAIGGWTDSFYLSEDAILDVNDTVFAQKIHTTDLAGLAIYTDTVTAPVPAINGGHYYVIYSINTLASLPETSRANNVTASTTAMALSLDINALSLNQQTIGAIESLFAVDHWTFSASATQTISLSDLHTESPSAVRFKLTGPNGFVGFSDLTSNSDVVVLPTTGTYTLEASSNAGGTGNYSFEIALLSSTPLQLGVPFTSALTASGFSQIFKLGITQAAPLRIEFDSANNNNQISIFTRLGSLPNRRVNDQHSKSIGADHTIDIPLTAPGNLYIVVSADHVTTLNDFTIRVDSQQVLLSRIAPNSFEAGTANANVIIEGLGFLPGTQVELVPASGPAIPAQSLAVDKSTQLSVMFDLATAAIGDYGVRVTLPSGANHFLASGFHVQPSGAGKLETHLILPSALGRHQPATLFLLYANVGTAAIAAPLIQVHSQDVDDSDRPLLTLDKNLLGVGLWTSAIPAGVANEVSIYATGATPGLILPGERLSVPIYYAGLQAPWDFSDVGIELGLSPIDTSDTRLVDYSTDFEKPDWITAETWPAILDNLQSQIGLTWGNYVEMLARNSAYLHRFGQDVRDVGELYRFEVQKANGLSAVGTLSSSVDAAAPSAGIPITFDRSFGNTITSRYKVGLFGRGWDAPAQAYLEKFADGTLLVHEANDSQRRFQPDIRRVGTYFSQTGDLAVMKDVSGGGYQLTETSGFKSRFRADGKLDFIQDINGNRVTYAYSGNQLTSMTSLSGSSLAIAYNGAGLISQISDSVGHVTTYAYDPTNSLLLSATGPSGTSTYTYIIGNGAARDFALLSETAPDGLTVHYEYDPQGRLTASYLDGNLQRVNFAYDGTGKVTSTDLAGVASHAFFDHLGLLVRSEDALGHYVVYKYNDLRQLIKTTDDLGRTVSYTRCDCGRSKTITDVYGRTILTFTLGGPNNQPLAFTDANGNVTSYGYDAAGNPTSTTYPDGTIENATYDSNGNLDVTTNRRGQLVDRAVNASGQVTHEVWSEGTIRDYVYDARGRLKMATDSVQGTTSLEYDTADRLTRIDYPNGRWITYTYDVAGRRTQIADNSGFATKYEYDVAGRLLRLRDATNALIVQYTYDAAGRLVREDKGNATYTIYGFDAAGRQTSIFNFAPDNSVNSKFIYTYDAAGRRDTQTTIDGDWTYSYDLVDQLTRAVFISTNPSIPNQDLNYEYDALGNRIRTILNGVTTTYSANNMNQYTLTGGVTSTYDLDGNLIQENGPSGLKHYTYDQLNRLIRVETPAGVWDYEYDVLGNRTAVIENGVRTEYLIDPMGSGNVIGEFNGAGAKTSSYTHGFGLESSTSVSGIAYYDFDAIGSTSGITSTVGIYVNQYAYDPWGKDLLSTEIIESSFEFVGQFGVMVDGNGLTFMRARYFNSGFGRFVAQDPIGLNGGINTYAYTMNSPIDHIDPSGLLFEVSGPGCDVQLGPSIGLGLSWPPFPFNNLGSCGCAVISISLFENASFPLFGEAPKPEPLPYCQENISQDTRFCRPKPGPPVCNDEPDADPQPVPQPDIPDCLRRPPEIPGTFSAEGGTCNPGPPIPVPMAVDPNEKFGAVGFGSQQFIANETTIPYRINFENLGPGSIPQPTTPATAPAQRVDVTDKLSPLLDWSSLEFTDFGWGDTVVAVPSGLSYYFATVGMTLNDKFFHVDVELNFDKTTGQILATFQSVDPATTLPPDVLTGFLPPEDGTDRGKAHVSFTIKPKSGLASGSELRNIAQIRFDFQDVIATNQIDPQNAAAGTDTNKEALNTIDAGTPTSSVAALPATTTTLTFPVTWSGSDEALGSGIATYDIFVSTNAGAWSLWLDDTTLHTSDYTGTSGSSYAFYSQASDNVGHVELAPIAADASTLVQTLVLLPPVVTLGGSQGSELDSATNHFTWLASDSDGTIAATSVTITRDGVSQTVPQTASGDFNFDALGLGIYIITVQATDNSGLSSDTVSRTVIVTDDDSTQPTITLGGSSGTESHGLMQLFTWSAVDSSGLNTSTVQVLKSGSSIFNSSSATGSFNFDAFGLGTYTLQVSAADDDNDWPGDASSNTASRQVTVTNAVPTAIDLAGSTLPENSGGGALVGILGAADPDTNDSALFSLVNDAGGRFQLSSNRLEVKPGAVLDFETTPNLTIRVAVVDAFGAGFERDLIIALSNVNEAPLSQNGVATAIEDGGLVSGQLLADDIDSDDDPATLSYSLISGASQGEVTVNVNGSFSFDPGGDFQDLAAGEKRYVNFTFQTIDRHQTLSNVATVSVTVTGVNDTATITGNPTGEVTEDSSITTATGLLNVSDPDAGESVFQVPQSLNGIYGLFSFNVLTGAWAYSLDNSRPVTNALVNGQIVRDSLVVKSLDATASQMIIITIIGADNSFGRAVLVLNPTACGALAMQGSASISVQGNVVVNSSCNKSSDGAVNVSGNSRITAGRIEVVGGVKKTNNATLSPAPITGTLVIPDPFAGLPSPIGSPATRNFSCSGNSNPTINPGSYTSIVVSGRCNLVFQPGIYVLAGGGMQISGNARVAGNAVTIYNAGSEFPSSGGSFGKITITGNATASFSPPTNGAFAGITIFQARDNAQQLLIGGNVPRLSGTLYAPSAQLVLSGNVQLHMTLAVDRLSVSGNAAVIQNIEIPGANMQWSPDPFLGHRSIFSTGASTPELSLGLTYQPTLPPNTIASVNTVGTDMDRWFIKQVDKQNLMAIAFPRETSGESNTAVRSTAKARSIKIEALDDYFEDFQLEHAANDSFYEALRDEKFGKIRNAIETLADKE